MADPVLIMLDEPMAGVNPALKQSLLQHIHLLKEEGRTVLFVEHDMDMVHEISDWVLVMAEGRLIGEGTGDPDLRKPGRDRCLPRRPSRGRPRGDGRGPGDRGARPGRRGPRCGRPFIRSPRRTTRRAGAQSPPKSRPDEHRRRSRQRHRCHRPRRRLRAGGGHPQRLQRHRRARGVRRDHRSQRRRQVDIPQGRARSRSRSAQESSASMATTSPASQHTSWSSVASGSFPRPEVPSRH